MSARRVAADVRCLHVQPVPAVSVLPRVPAAGKPEAKAAGRVRMVLARCRRVDLAETRSLEQRGTEVGGNSPGDDGTSIAHEPPAHERRRHRDAVPRRRRGRSACCRAPPRSGSRHPLASSGRATCSHVRRRSGRPRARRSRGTASARLRVTGSRTGRPFARRSGRAPRSLRYGRAAHALPPAGRDAPSE